VLGCSVSTVIGMLFYIRMAMPVEVSMFIFSLALTIGIYRPNWLQVMVLLIINLVTVWQSRVNWLLLVQ